MVSFKTAWTAFAGMVTGRGPVPTDPDRGTQTDNPSGDGATEGSSGGIEIVGDIADNVIELGENITLTGVIRGRGNVIRIAASRNLQTLNLHVHGNNNTVTIGARSVLQNLRVEIGSERWQCSRSRLIIGKGFSIASQSRFILPNSGNIVEIGNDCMFSSNIVVRAGEYPHLIFDRDTGDYLDVSEGIFIGDHVWVGDGAFVGKSVTLPAHSIIGTRSVVTKRFDETHCVIAGNPARIVKRAVQWIANEYTLEREFPLGRGAFAHTEVDRINRAERERERDAALLDHENRASAEPDKLD